MKNAFVIIRKLGILKELLPEHGPTHDDVMAWAKEEARLETLKYKQEQENKRIQITFMLTGSWVMINRLSFGADIFFSSTFIIRCISIKSATN